MILKDDILSASWSELCSASIHCGLVGSSTFFLKRCSMKENRYKKGLRFSRPWPGIIILDRGEFGKRHPGWGRENRYPFFTVYYPLPHRFAVITVFKSLKMQKDMARPSPVFCSAARWDLTRARTIGFLSSLNYFFMERNSYNDWEMPAP